MMDITSELKEAVSYDQSLSDAWNELMCFELEHCVNELLQSKLTSFLDYNTDQ